MCSYYDYLDDYRFMNPEEFEDEDKNQTDALKVTEVCIKTIEIIERNNK